MNWIALFRSLSRAFAYQVEERAGQGGATVCVRLLHVGQDLT
jgi:hypothetical protein